VRELQGTIDTIIQNMELHGANWMELLNKLALVNVQHMQVGGN
jgi:hypothetical protein